MMKANLEVQAQTGLYDEGGMPVPSTDVGKRLVIAFPEGELTVESTKEGIVIVGSTRASRMTRKLQEKCRILL